MPWTVLLLAVGSLASSVPAPSIVLAPPYPSSQDDPMHIACIAPFLGVNFTLYREGEVLRFLQAPEDQPEVTFTVTAGAYGETAGRDFRCQYSVIGEHGHPQLSELSQPLQVSFPGSTWVLALSLGLVGAILLVTGLAAIALVVRKVKTKKLQKQREKESCWAQINFTNTDLSFDNSLFVLSTKMTPEDDPTATLDTPSCNSEPGKRPTSSSSSSEPPEFSTFRPCPGD